MKTQILAIISLFTLATAPLVHALSAEIGAPEFGHVSGIDDAQKKRVSELLKFMREELEFVDGRFINEFSHQRYGGSSKKVAEFITRLSAAASGTVKVEFRDLKDPDKVSCILSQVSSKTTLVVNTACEGLRLKDFKEFLKAAEAAAPEKEAAKELIESPESDDKAGE